jgi:hypothetical protein
MKSICSADHIIGYNESVTAKGERNDCVVRAMASTFGLSYDVAHKFVADEFERKPRKGTFATSIKLKNRMHNVMGIGYKIIPRENLLYSGSTRHQANGGKPVPITLSIFLERFSKGKYFVIKKGHAFSVIDGVVIGNVNEGERLKTKILFALKVEE